MKKRSDCPRCGLSLNDEGEYHPQTFCRMVRVGVNPWQLVADTLWHKGWEKESALILRRFNVRDMNQRARKIA